VDATSGPTRRGENPDGGPAPLQSAHEEGEAMTRTAERVSWHRDGYDHLALLFAAWRALPAAHPRRMRLRRELIVGYHPVAAHIVRKYTCLGRIRTNSTRWRAWR
jgi:hypothetical protein